MSQLSELFEEFKASQPKGLRWRVYFAGWRLGQFLTLYDYIKRPWLILIAPKGKRPFPGFMWADQSLSQREAIYFLGAGYNLGLVTGLSRPRLCVLDLDTQRSDLRFNTLTQRTPRGLQFFFVDDVKDRPKIVEWAKARGFDNPRTGITYVLIPPSITCAKDTKEHKHEGQPHEWRVRYWAQLAPIRPISEVMKA
jgi:hypothetical protein